MTKKYYEQKNNHWSHANQGGEEPQQGYYTSWMNTGRGEDSFHRAGDSRGFWAFYTRDIPDWGGTGVGTKALRYLPG